MNNQVGKVIEVFIPNNNINSFDIGFKILFNNEIIEIIEEQDEYNSHIYKDDIVLINNFEDKYEIEKYNGGTYE